MMIKGTTDIFKMNKLELVDREIYFIAFNRRDN